jgi:two-component system sensor kinase FixL
VLDEACIIVEPSFRESAVSMRWEMPDGLPLVEADQQNLLQVFLNLLRNSQRAMEETERKELSVQVSADQEAVTVRFRDTGCGVADPERLFRPFQQGAEEAGLGLYVSRAILRSHDGDLRYEPQPAGSCFVVELRPAGEDEGAFQG